MRFAALALLAAVFFADDAEAKRGGRGRGRGGRGGGGRKRKPKGVTASCIVEADAEDDAAGTFFLHQRTSRDGNAKAIHIGGKFTDLDSALDWSVEAYSDADCVTVIADTLTDLDQRSCSNAD